MTDQLTLGGRPDPLELELATLARDAFPPTPDLAAAIRERIEREGIRPSAGWREQLGLGRPPGVGGGLVGWPIRLRRSALVAIVALLVLAAVTVAGALGIGPLRIVFVRELPSPAPTGTPSPGGGPGFQLSLGDRVPIEAARAAVTIPLRMPDGFDRPDAVYLDRRPSEPAVTFVWRIRDDLPETYPSSGYGMLLTQVRGTQEPDMLKKLLQDQTNVRWTTVDGNEALFLDGKPHIFMYLDTNGRVIAESSRVVGDVLIWQADGVLHRLETALGFEATVRLAGSLDR